MSSFSASEHDNSSASGISMNLVQCERCTYVVNRRAVMQSDGHPHCPRCAAVLHRRKPDSQARTWALVITALLFYIPANVLPIMHTSAINGNQSNTIMGGVLHLWHLGSYDLAIIVFVASVVVPLGKMLSLALLTLLNSIRYQGHPKARTHLYAVLELIGPWSMLDIFVVALLAAIVQFRGLASIQPGLATVAFAMVVILTMLAAKSYDPRLTWDLIEAND